MDATKLDFLKKKKKKKKRKKKELLFLIIVSETHVWPCNTEAL